MNRRFDPTCLASSLESSAGRDHLPTALDVYRAGVLLRRVRVASFVVVGCCYLYELLVRVMQGIIINSMPNQQEEREASESYTSLSSAFRQMVSSLPEPYLRDVILLEINRAFVEVVDRKRHDIDDGDMQAMSAVFGIYNHSDGSSTCRL